MNEYKCQLELETADKPESWTSGCDGCGRVLQEGDLSIGNIDSCCGGGCTRSICADCVKAAYKMIEDAENKAAGLMKITVPGRDPGGYTTASAAVGRMLADQNFDKLVVDQGWLELRMVASFQEKGAMFREVSVAKEVHAVDPTMEEIMSIAKENGNAPDSK